MITRMIPLRLAGSLGLASALILHALPVFAFQATATPPATKAQTKTAAKVDLNKATAAELQELPGIGPATATAIIDARPFKSVSDLENVKGIGPAKFAELKGLVTATPKAEVPKAEMTKKKAATAKDELIAKKAAAPKTEVTKFATGPKVDLNKATAAELEELPGIGPATSKAIIDARPFKSVNDLENVKGIGPAKFAEIRDRVEVRPAATPKVEVPKAEAPKAAPARTEPAKKAMTAKAETPRTKAATPSTGKVNINTASKQELDGLPGVGPVKAQAIIDARPYKSVDDLIRAKGIGHKTLEKLRDLVTVE